MPSDIVIGIDLDNTLVCYDELFFQTARNENLIEGSVPKSKKKIRDAIRKLHGGEARWTRLQAIVYGPRMSGATLFDGIATFFEHCAAARIPSRIVSHKTPFAMLDGERVDLRASALDWMKDNGFFDRFALSPSDVFFETTRAEKIERIRSLGCTHFIDDLTEVFCEPAFPRDVVKLLFAPHGTQFVPPGVQVFDNWLALDRFFFDDTGR